MKKTPRKGMYVIFRYDLWPYMLVHQIDSVTTDKKTGKKDISVLGGYFHLTTVTNDRLVSKEKGQMLEAIIEHLRGEHNIAKHKVDSDFMEQFVAQLKEYGVKHPEPKSVERLCKSRPSPRRAPQVKESLTDKLVRANSSLSKSLGSKRVSRSA